MSEIKEAIENLANSISPIDGEGTDAVNGTVRSLTEAIMGVTKAGTEIARALDNIADAIRERK